MAMPRFAQADGLILKLRASRPPLDGLLFH